MRNLMKNQPPITIDFHAFKDEYGLPSEEINPHMIKNKDVQEVEFKKVFKATQGRMVTLLLIVIMFKWWIKSMRSIQLFMLKQIS
jgi:hypothetical protein